MKCYVIESAEFRRPTAFFITITYILTSPLLYKTYSRVMEI